VIDATAVNTLIVLPAFNEEVALPGVVREILRAVPGATLLVIDDGSSDHTTQAAQEIGVDVVTLPFNLGVGGALRAGFRYAARHGFTSMVQVDADGQHDPAAIPDLLARLQSADLVIGARFAGRDDYQVERARRFAMWLLARSLSHRTKTRLTDTTSGFRAFGPRAIALFAQQYPAEYLGDTIEALLIAAREDLVVAQVPVVMRPRAGGTPSHSPLSSAVLLARTLPAFVLPRPRLTPAGIHHSESR
jgi:glycosyltransferase involved in cell wall biosynthesis